MSSSESSTTVTQQKKPMRPESTMALNFSQALDGVFNLGGELPNLSMNVDERKRSVKDSNKELEELEARLKAAEERLSKAGITPAPTASPTDDHNAVQSAATATAPSTNGVNGHAPQAHASTMTQRIPSRPAPARPSTAPQNEDEEDDDDEDDDEDDEQYYNSRTKR